MQDKKKMGAGSTFLAVIVAFLLVVGFFYGMDHFIMNIQGLPLNADLTPAG